MNRITLEVERGKFIPYQEQEKRDAIRIRFQKDKEEPVEWVQGVVPIFQASPIVRTWIKTPYYMEDDDNIHDSVLDNLGAELTEIIDALLREEPDATHGDAQDPGNSST